VPRDVARTARRSMRDLA